MKYFIVILFYFSFCQLNIYSQVQDKKNVKICGVIYSSDHQSRLSDVVINDTKTHENTISDASGYFCINTKYGHILSFLRLGYKTKQIKVSSDSLSIVLDELSGTLNEVVVVAGKNINDIDIRQIAGSIVTIDMKKLAGRSEIDILRLLQGQVAGLAITTSGELGTKPTVRIRGESSFVATANEPLYVLDGVVISSEAFLALNAEDFDEIKVLKDAAASALYGIKAANGVIEITSKRGYVGKPTITLSAKYGVTFKGSRGVGMMSSAEKLELERLIKNESTPGYRYSPDYYYKYYLNDPNLNNLIASGQMVLDSLRGINTDWFDELIKMNTFQNYSVGIRGGTEKNTYSYSLSYGKQGGRIEGNDVQRFTARISQDYYISPQFNLSLNVGGGYSETNTPNGSSYDPSSLVYNLNPYEQKNDPKTGKPSQLYSYKERTFYDLMNEYSRKTTAKRVESSVISHWNIMQGLDFSGVAGFDYLLNENLGIIPFGAYSQRNYKEDARGELTQNKATEFNVTSNLRINYSKLFGDHDITLGGNTDYYLMSYDGIGIQGYGLPSKMTTAAGINQGLKDSRRVRSNSRKEKNAQFGIGFVAGYSYKGIYDAYGSYKRDASSLLPKDKRWNTAWSVGAGWKLGNYPFFKENNILTNIKLRASYGYTAGMAGITASSTIPTFAYSNDVYASGRIFEMKMLYNKDIKPQQTKNLNIGTDIELFKRITFTADIYKNRTEDAILSVPIPPSNGYTDMMRNIGVLENHGVEFRVSGNIIESDDFRWNSSISLSWNGNKVVELYDGDKLYLGNDKLLPDMEVGKPVGTLYGLRSLGINPIDGLPRFLSATGEEIDYKHKLTSEDFVELGYSTPPYMGFFNNSIAYKAFTLSFDFYFSFGGIQPYSRNYVRDYSDIQYNAVKGQIEDMWFKPGDENKIYYTPNLPSGAYDFLNYATTKTVFKTDYIRLNNMTFSYRVPGSILSKAENIIKYLNFNVQAQNLFTIRKETDKASLVNVVQPVVTLGFNASF